MLVHYLVRAAGRDANFLLNVGPRPDGTIDPKSAERLERVGDWLRDYAATVKGTREGPVAPQPWGVSTRSADIVFLHLLEPPQADAEGWITLTGTNKLNAERIKRFASDAQVAARRNDQGQLVVRVDELADIDTVLVVELP